MKSLKRLKPWVAFVLIFAFAYVGLRQVNARMPDVWSGTEVDREIHAFCEGGIVVDVHIDKDKDGIADLFAYYLIHSEAPVLKELRPFLIQVANEPVDTDIKGDMFYIDYDLDGKVDAKETFPSEALGQGPCTPAARVKGASSLRGSLVRL